MTEGSALAGADLSVEDQEPAGVGFVIIQHSRFNINPGPEAGQAQAPERVQVQLFRETASYRNVGWLMRSSKLIKMSGKKRPSEFQLGLVRGSS